MTSSISALRKLTLSQSNFFIFSSFSVPLNSSLVTEFLHISSLLVSFFLPLSFLKCCLYLGSWSQSILLLPGVSFLWYFPLFHSSALDTRTVLRGPLVTATLQTVFSLFYFSVAPPAVGHRFRVAATLTDTIDFNTVAV